MTRLCCFLRGGHRWAWWSQPPYSVIKCRRCGVRA